MPDEVDSVRKEREIEPIFEGYQLIGDSQLLRFAEQLLHKARKTKERMTYLGFCVSGQKSGELLERLKNDFYVTSKKAVVMIGTNDMLQGIPVSEMCRNVESLVDELTRKRKMEIFLLTLPPVPRLVQEPEHWKRLNEYNEFIRKRHNDKNIFVIEACQRFINVSKSNEESSSDLDSSVASTRTSKSLDTPGGTSTPMSSNERERLSGRKRKIGDVEAATESGTSNGKKDSSEFPTPPSKRASAVLTNEDLGKIKMEYFERYFIGPNPRQDLIHLNKRGLHTIKKLIMKEIKNQKLKAEADNSS